MLAHIIRDGSRRNRHDGMRWTHCTGKSNGYAHAEPFAAEARLKQYVEAARGEPARQHATEAHAGLSQPGHPLLPDGNGSHGGCSRSGHE